MRTLLVLTLALGLAPLAVAQPTFGLRAGLNVADVSNTFQTVEDDFAEFGAEADAQPRLGLMAGVFAEIPLTPQVSVRPEVLYSQKGSRLNVETPEDVDGDFDIELDIDYLEVPVLARFAVPASPTLEVGLMAGPSFGFKLSESFEQGGEDFSEGEEDVIASTDIGVALGAEVGSGPFFVDLRYTLGLSDVSDGEADEDDGTPRNGVFAVTGTFKFGR